MTVGSAASRRVLARTPVAPLPASSPTRPTGITGRMSAPAETSSPEVCGFRLPLTPAAHLARRRGHDGGRRRQGSGHGPRAGVGGRACRRADPDGFRRGRRSAGNSVSTYGSHARIGQTDRVCQFGCGILNACRSLIAWLTALVRSRLGGCPVFASAARWSPSRGSPVAERAGKTGKRGAFTSV